MYSLTCYMYVIFKTLCTMTCSSKIIPARIPESHASPMQACTTEAPTDLQKILKLYVICKNNFFKHFVIRFRKKSYFLKFPKVELESRNKKQNFQKTRIYCEKNQRMFVNTGLTFIISQAKLTINFFDLLIFTR